MVNMRPKNQMNWSWRVWMIKMVDWSDLPSLSSFKGIDSFCDIHKVILDSMIDDVYELDIPSLTEDHIQMRGHTLINVKALNSSSRIDWLLMIKMPILWNTTSLRIVILLHLNTCYLSIHQHSGYQELIKWKRYGVMLNRLLFKEQWEWKRNHLIFLIFLLSSLLKLDVVHLRIVIQ